MSTRDTGSDFNSQIYDEASEWFVEMRSGDVDAAGRRRFDTWVRKSPEHLRAYLEISEIWDDAQLVDARRKSRPEDLVARAREGAEVVVIGREPVGGDTLTAAVSAITRSAFHPGLSKRRFAAAVAIVAIAVGFAAFFNYEHHRSPTYTTEIGEHRVVVLADGSRVEINSRTRLTVHFTEYERDIDLLEGQALFKVAKNAERPFIVRSGDITARAVGTEFDVDRKQSATTVTVIEGRVAVHVLEEAALKEASPDLVTAPPPIFLGAGEQVSASRHRPLRALRANVSAATAWTHGSLVFAGSRLGDVVEEFNRYNDRQLVIRDPTLADMHISGVYTSTDPSLFVRFLREQPSLSVEETDSQVVISAK
jgi:transmembrane sensor